MPSWSTPYAMKTSMPKSSNSSSRRAGTYNTASPRPNSSSRVGHRHSTHDADLCGLLASGADVDLVGGDGPKVEPGGQGRRGRALADQRGPDDEIEQAAGEVRLDPRWVELTGLGAGIEIEDLFLAHPHGRPLVRLPARLLGL
jgi:hypothetical protein